MQHAAPSRTLRDLLALGMVAAAIATGATILFDARPTAQAQTPSSLPFPAWELDCSGLEREDTLSDGTVQKLYALPYDLTFTSRWIVNQQTPSTGYLLVDAVGERDTYAVAQIISAQDQLNWANEITARGIDPTSAEAKQLAMAKGSYSVKEVDATGSAAFRFGWWMFSPNDEQLSITVKGCKTTSNVDEERSFFQTTYPNAAVTITNVERVTTVCTTCSVTTLFDCEHVALTPVVIDPSNYQIVLGDSEDPLNPIDSGGDALVQGPSLQELQYDWLAKLADSAKGPLFNYDANLTKYTRHPDQRMANTGLVDGMGQLAYFIGPGLSQEITANPDTEYQAAGALVVADFATFFSVPEHQTLRVRSGQRGYIIHPVDYLDFSAEVRLGCTSGAWCGTVVNGEVQIEVDQPAAADAPLQVLLFVPKIEGDTNGDALVDDLDALPESCVDDPTTCQYTVRGKVLGLDGATIHLYAGGSNPIYETKSVTITSGSYEFTNVFPGQYVIKVDQNTETYPCHLVHPLKVGIDTVLPTWKIADANRTIAVEDLDGTGMCWSKQN